MFFCSSFQSYSLVYCSVLSVSVTASVLYLIPSSSHSLALFICFPPPSFITPKKKKKKKESTLKIFRGGRRVLAEAMWRDEEGRCARKGRKRRREGERIWYDVWLQCQQTDPRPVWKRLESYSKQRGHCKGYAPKLIIRSLSEHSHTWHWRLTQ